MTAAHTPGPWKLDNEPAFHRNRVWTQDMRPIVNLCSMGTAPADIDPEAQANACLIAAAPELLEALEGFDNWFSSFNPECQYDRMVGRKVIIAARTAIAKARGAA